MGQPGGVGYKDSSTFKLKIYSRLKIIVPFRFKNGQDTELNPYFREGAEEFRKVGGRNKEVCKKWLLRNMIIRSHHLMASSWAPGGDCHRHRQTASPETRKQRAIA